MRPQGALLSQARNAARGGGLSLEMRIRQMFAAQNLDGFILDAGDISTLNQVSTGTTPVTAVTQPIGWFGDKHLGMQLGPELVTNGVNPIVTTGWTGYKSTLSANGTLTATNTEAAEGYAYQGASVAGKTYRVQFDVVAMTTATRTIQCGSTPVTVSGTGTKLLYLTATNTNGIWIGVGGATIGNTVTVNNISVKLLDGNHPRQATAAARPSWQVDANGYHYAQLLGTDDSLSCATGGGGDAGFLLCVALKPTGGAGTLRTIYSDVGTNTGYKVQIDTNNKLSFSAGNGTAFTTKVSTADFSVGTTYLLTVWDDGTNLNVQINSEAAETVARPIVVAGTAGYTLFKDNGAASSFAILDFYRADGIKDWAGTAAELAAIQSWVKAGAGL